MKCQLLFLLGLCVHLASQNVAWAEEEKAADQKEVAVILQRWEAASRHVDTLDVRFKRIERNSTFGVEQRGSGRFVWMRPNRGIYIVKPATLRDRAVSNQRPPDGERFVVESGDSEAFYWDGESIYRINDDAKMYQRVKIPVPEKDAESSIFSFLMAPQRTIPMVADIQAKQLMQDYAWSLVKKNDEEIRLLAKPRTKALQRNFSRIEVILAAKSFRTIATKQTDPAGSTTVAHAFEESEAKPGTVPWKPDLAKYKQELPPN